MKRWSRLRFLAGAVLVAGGCASSPSEDGPFARARARAEHINIKVVNLNFADATLWVVTRGGMRHRLGMVTGKDEGYFTVPWTFSAPLSIEIDMVAGPHCASDSITADPGDVIELRIEVAFADASACRSFPLSR